LRSWGAPSLTLCTYKLDLQKIFKISGFFLRFLLKQYFLCRSFHLEISFVSNHIFLYFPKPIAKVLTYFNYEKHWNVFDFQCLQRIAQSSLFKNLSTFDKLNPKHISNSLSFKLIYFFFPCHYSCSDQTKFLFISKTSFFFEISVLWSNCVWSHSQNL